MIDSQDPGLGRSSRPDGLEALPEHAPAHGVRLRLYVARSTPNSVRAEHNVTSALNAIGDENSRPKLEIVDVFAHPKRAITDSVLVTPTLIGMGLNGRLTIIGDLGDAAKLRQFIQSLS